MTLPETFQNLPELQNFSPLTYGTTCGAHLRTTCERKLTTCERNLWPKNCGWPEAPERAAGHQGHVSFREPSGRLPETFRELNLYTWGFQGQRKCPRRRQLAFHIATRLESVKIDAWGFASGDSSGNLPEPSGTAVKLEPSEQASGKSSGNLLEPSGTAGKSKCPNLYFWSLPASLPETNRELSGTAGE